MERSWGSKVFPARSSVSNDVKTLVKCTTCGKEMISYRINGGRGREGQTSFHVMREWQICNCWMFVNAVLRCSGRDSESGCCNGSNRE